MNAEQPAKALEAAHEALKIVLLLQAKYPDAFAEKAEKYRKLYQELCQKTGTALLWFKT